MIKRMILLDISNCTSTPIGKSAFKIVNRCSRAHIRYIKITANVESIASKVCNVCGGLSLVKVYRDVESIALEQSTRGRERRLRKMSKSRNTERTPMVTISVAFVSNVLAAVGPKRFAIGKR